jgi:hypothetical protein
MALGLRKQSCGGVRLHRLNSTPGDDVIASVGNGVQKTELPTSFTIPFG